ncbi:hypothetical protein B0G80_4711 [Paraburkholderia sp. BL6669N2]|nr:hypothetical protein B0G80_4711 [Paraburkholderia sp. BL6669N2]
MCRRQQRWALNEGDDRDGADGGAGWVVEDGPLLRVNYARTLV